MSNQENNMIMCRYCARLAGALIREAVENAEEGNSGAVKLKLRQARDQAAHDHHIHTAFPPLSKGPFLTLNSEKIDEIERRLLSRVK